MKPELLSALKFLDCLETWQTVWKLSGQSGHFPDCLETFRTVQKLSRQSGNFPDCLGTFRTARKLSRLSGKFPDSPDSFRTVPKVLRISLLTHMCCESYLRTFGAFFFVAKANHALLAYFCNETIYALRPETFCA